MTLADDLLSGRRESRDTVRDTLLHTVACKAAIKAGWKNDEKELLAVAQAVMAREELKYLLTFASKPPLKVILESRSPL